MIKLTFGYKTYAEAFKHSFQISTDNRKNY